MSVAAVARPGRRGRPLRAAALLMLAMLAVQWAAQWCALHCGVAAQGVVGPFAAAEARMDLGAAVPAVAARAGESVADVEAAPVGATVAPGVADPGDGVAPAHAGCGVEGWCELGQTPPLAAGEAVRVAPLASAASAAVPRLRPTFLSTPEERPPIA